jgi:hypothetical protein
MKVDQEGKKKLLEKRIVVRKKYKCGDQEEKKYLGSPIHRNPCT